MKLIKHSSSNLNFQDYKNLKKVFNCNFVGPGIFEKQLTDFLKKKTNFGNFVTTKSGYSALIVALQSLNLKKKSCVIIPAYSCYSIKNAVNFLDLKPVYADLDFQSPNMSIDNVVNILKTKNNVKAIIYPHNIGYIDNRIKFLKKFKIPIIEDFSACLNSFNVLNNKNLKSDSIIKTFSFNSTKPVTGGLGGAICTKNKKIYKNILKLLAYDEPANIKSKLFFNERLSDLNCCLILSQLKKIQKDYFNLLKFYLSIKKFNKNLIDNNTIFIPWRYIFFIKNKNRIKKIFLRKKIEFKNSFGFYLADNKNFKNAKNLENFCFTLPIGNFLKMKEKKRILNFFKKEKINI